MLEAEVNPGILNVCFEGVNYKGVTESEAAYIRGRGRESQKLTPENTLTNIIF